MSNETKQEVLELVNWVLMVAALFASVAVVVKEFTMQWPQ